MKDIQQKHKKLCKIIEKYNTYYYIKNKPLISDFKYDKIYKKLEKLEEKYPELKQNYSPTQKIGTKLPKDFKFEKYKRDIPMLSLDNTYNIKEIFEFFQRANMIARKENIKYIEYLIEPKVDGISIDLYYKNNFLHKAVTRGDGKEGSDITVNIKAIKSIPKYIPSLLESKDLNIRGEIFMAYDDFKKLNEKGEKTFRNPRNAAGGTLHIKNPSLVAERNLKFIPYEIIFKDFKKREKLSQIKAIQFFKKSKFITFKKIFTCDASNKEKIKKIIKFWYKYKEKIGYPVDGLVIKVNDYKIRDILGNTAKYPRSSIAYKFPAEQKVTKILDVRFQLGRTGVITPVAILKPVMLAGSKIARATLHNYDYIKEKELHIGDFVYIEKAGEIIPQVVKIKKRGKNRRKINFPEKCPKCGEILIHKTLSNNKKEKALRCINPLCKGKRLQNLINFVSKNCMNIDTLGEKVIKKLYKKKLINTFSDIYKLTKEDLLNIELVKTKKADNIIKAIATSKNIEFYKFIMALGIPNIGKANAEKLEIFFGSFDSFLKIISENNRDFILNNLVKEEGFGKNIIKEMVLYLFNPYIIEQINELKKLGVKPYTKNKIKSNKFEGLKFCITGKHKIPRKKIEEIIKSKNGKIVKNVSKNTDYLICGENYGSKHEKAKKLKIKIISMEEMENL